MSIAQVVDRYRYPRYAWGWKPALLTLALVVAPQLSAALLLPGPRDLADSAAVAGLALYPVVFVSGVFLYLHWRLTGLCASYWLTVSLTLVSVHGVTLSVLQMVGPDTFVLRPLWLIGGDVAVGLALLVMLQAAERFSPSLDPAAAGLLLGLAVAVPEVLVARAPAGLPAPSTIEVPAMVLLVAIGALLVPAAHELRSLPAWGRDRLGLAAVVLSVHRVLSHPPAPDGLGWHTTTLVTGMVGSVLLCGACLALLRAAIHDDRTAIRRLEDLLAVAELGARADRDLLHQIRSTVAGISSASALIAAGPPQEPVAAAHQRLLEELVARETARLQRLVDDRRAVLDEVVELDEVLCPLAAAQQARGRSVRWRPCGERVHGSADRITEVVQTLLDNARAHAGEVPVEIEVRRTGSVVEVTVADDGPGVPPELQASLFERGARRAGSTGEGIGLHVAQALMEDGGSTLRLDQSRTNGAAFVLRLPAATGEVREA